MVQMRIQKLKERCNPQISVNEEFDKIARDLKLIIENTERVSDILKNVTQKSINEQLDEIQPINLCLLLREELNFLEADMTFKHKIEKVCYLDETIPYLHGVYSHFSHSFMHILNNSILAMEKATNKKLTITGRYDGNSIVMEFNDSGCGIDKDKCSTLINLLNDKTLQKTKNNGGLSQVKMLLAPYKPSFDINSIPGNTNITIQFPA